MVVDIHGKQQGFGYPRVDIHQSIIVIDIHSCQWISNSRYPSKGFSEIELILDTIVMIDILISPRISK